MRIRPFRRWLGPKLYARADRWLLARTSGRHALTGAAALPTLLLTTTGRRTGEPRSVALLAVPDDDGFVVVASNWGRKNHPAWSENLLADERATVSCARGTFDVRARLCSPAETARRWPGLAAAMPVWDAYRELTERELRVFVLERSSGARKSASRTSASRTSAP